MENRISNKIRGILSEQSYTLAIFNNGSSVVGTDTPESDIDFTIIVKSKADINKALKLLKSNISFLGVEHDVPHFDFQRKIGICIYDKRTIEFFIKTLYKSKEDFIKLQNVLQHKIVEAIPIYDSNRILVKYQNSVKSYPIRIQNLVFSDAMKFLEGTYEEWYFNNEFNFIFHLPEIIEKICLAIYSKNKRLFMLPYKRLSKDLKELKPNIEKEMYFLVKGNNSKKNRDKKRLVLKEIIDKLKL